MVGVSSGDPLRHPEAREPSQGKRTPLGVIPPFRPVRDYRTQRVLSQLDDEGGSASVEFVYRDRYRDNPFTDTRENRHETRDFLFVREDGEWRIDAVNEGFGGPDGAYIPSDTALTKACGSNRAPCKGATR